MAKAGPGKARRDGSGLRKLVRMVQAARVVDHSMFGSASGTGP